MAVSPAGDVNTSLGSLTSGVKLGAVVGAAAVEAAVVVGAAEDGATAVGVTAALVGFANDAPPEVGRVFGLELPPQPASSVGATTGPTRN